MYGITHVLCSVCHTALAKANLRAENEEDEKEKKARGGGGERGKGVYLDSQYARRRQGRGS
jgi:hypothetical protein